MKKLSKLLALLLALAVAFSLAACSNNSNTEAQDDTITPTAKEEEAELTDEELLVGTWHCRFDVRESIGRAMLAMLGQDAQLPDSPIYADITLDFKNSGEFVTTMSLDRDSFTEYMLQLADDVMEFMYKTAEADGVSREDMDAQLKDEHGVNMEEYVDGWLNEYVDATVDAMATENDSAYYKVDPQTGRICIADEQENLDSTQAYMEYTFTERKLTVKKLVNENGEAVNTEAMGMEMPWKFEKQ